MRVLVTGSIVLFQSDENILKSVITSFLDTEMLMRLYLIDNSPTDTLRDIIDDDRIIYIHNPTNPGFGAAHNVAIEKAISDDSFYHFVINPDVYINKSCLSDMVDFMEKNLDVGMLMPKILNIDGSVQFLPKLLPSPLSVIKRILNRKFNLFSSFVRKYELRDVAVDISYDAPILSGCFTLFRISCLKEVGLYDDKFFMYFEDWDLSRRMQERFRTVYLPQVSVVHGYESGANKSSQLFRIYLQSYKWYFTKWGWFIDKKRLKINRLTLNQFK